MGELCVLKLIQKTIDCAEDSLLLIDELELALHPRAQIELFNYLTDIAKQKNLTVIFSTHSVTLLKSTPRDNILFLETKGRKVTTLKGCFPTYALGNIAYDEERAPDIAIFVEDESALHIAETFKDLALARKLGGNNALFPSVQVVPIGPFKNVIQFLDNSSALLSNSTQSFALLDGDVKSETVRDWRRSNNHGELQQLERLKHKIQYLPWTPEVALMKFLSNKREGVQNQIRQATNSNQFNIRRNLICDIPEDAGGDQRRACKRSLRDVTTHMANTLQNYDEARSRRLLFQIFATDYFNENTGEIMGILGPILARH